LQCVDAVFEELLRIVSQLESKELVRFNILRERVVSAVTELLHECRGPSREMIQNLVHIELAFVNTSHEDFVGAEGAINAIVDRVSEEKMSHRERELQAQMQQRIQEAEAQNAQQQQAGRGKPGAQGQKPPALPAHKPPNQAPAQAHATPQSHPGRVPSTRTTPTAKPKPKPGKPKLTLDNVPMTIKAEGQLSEREQVETDLIKSLLESYFIIVRKNTQDTVPKSIMHFLVNKSKELVHNRLVEKLYKEENFDELLGESPDIAARRKATREMVAMLKRATEILNEVRDYTIK